MNLKIKTQVTTEHEKEIKVPSYWKETDSDNLLAVIDERTCVGALDLKDYTSLTVCTPKNMEDKIAQAAANWIAITEEEFMTGYRILLQTISLEPALK